jgi:capsular exopolysaccharide synthesis family protein
LEEPQALDHIDLQRWLRGLRQRWWVVLGCLLLVGGSAAAFALTRQKQYTATASVLFSESQIGNDLLGIINTSNSQTAPQADDVKLVQSSQVALRTSHALAGRLDPLGIAAKVSVSEVGTSDVVAVQAQDTSPRFAAQLANVYARQAIEFVTFTNRSQVTQVRGSLQSQLAGMTPAQRQSSAGLSLQARISQLSTLAAAQTGNAQLIEPATVPSSPSSPKTKLDIILGGFLGLLFGIGLALLLERLNRQVRGMDELGEIYGFPVLAEIPESAALQQEDSSKNDARGHNSIDMLRARLRYFNVDGQMKSLLVTSCAPQEGKTTVAWHLARASAVSIHGGRVLLLEADLRRPSLAAARGLREGPGLSDVLAGDCGHREVVQHVEITSLQNGAGPEWTLDVIVAGAVPPNPAELIESERMKQLLRALTDEYDFIVVDSGPALVVPDPLALMSQVAGVLVVSRLGGTTRDAAFKLREELLAVRAPVVGVVANRVKHSIESTYYQSYVASPPTRETPVTASKNGAASDAAEAIEVAEVEAIEDDAAEAVGASPGKKANAKSDSNSPNKSANDSANDSANEIANEILALQARLAGLESPGEQQAN